MIRSVLAARKVLRDKGSQPRTLDRSMVLTSLRSRAGSKVLVLLASACWVRKACLGGASHLTLVLIVAFMASDLLAVGRKE